MVHAPPQTQGGGNAANALTAGARLGLRTKLVTQVGVQGSNASSVLSCSGYVPSLPPAPHPRPDVVQIGDDGLGEGMIA